MKHKQPCAKCGSTCHKTSRHHIIPKCHGLGYGGRVHLCRKPCHDEIEIIYQDAERKEAEKHRITCKCRFRLPDWRYRELLTTWLNE